jgi:ribosome-associated protein
MDNWYRPVKLNQYMTAEALSKVIVKGMEEKKASEILVMDLRKIKNSVTDFFVICSGNSDTQLEAISESIEAEIKKANENPARKVEGKSNGEWVLMDYFDVVVHIFLKEKRNYYGLEELWGDAKTIRVN